MLNPELADKENELPFTQMQAQKGGEGIKNSKSGRLRTPFDNLDNKSKPYIGSRFLPPHRSKTPVGARGDSKERIVVDSGSILARKSSAISSKRIRDSSPSQIYQKASERIKLLQKANKNISDIHSIGVKGVPNFDSDSRKSSILSRLQDRIQKKNEIALNGARESPPKKSVLSSNNYPQAKKGLEPTKEAEPPRNRRITITDENHTKDGSQTKENEFRSLRDKSLSKKSSEVISSLNHKSNENHYNHQQKSSKKLLSSPPLPFGEKSSLSGRRSSKKEEDVFLSDPPLKSE